MIQAVRSLRRSPAYTVTAILTLGLGIGLTTAAFSLLNGFVLRPLPFVDQDSLVDLSETSATELCTGCGVGASFPIYQEWRDAARSFARMEAIVERPFNVSSSDRPAARIGGALVSAGLFDLLGVAPVAGRTFTPQDDRAGAAPVAIISSSVWQEQFGGASLTGQTLRIDGVDHAVIGVMPPGFGFPEFARLWIPLAPQAREWPVDDRSLSVVARLLPEVTIAAAQEEMTALGRSIAERFPASHRAWTIKLRPLRESFIGDEAQLFALLVGMVLIVLLIACVNLAGVGLARAASRQRELAVRVAIGATGRDLRRLLMSESLLLAALGGALGFILAPWAVAATTSLLPAAIPAWLGFDIDWRVAVFSGIVTIAAGFGAGLLPAWRASHPDVLGALKAGAGAGHDGQRLRRWLVAGELALALMLLVSGGLLTRTFVRALTADPGYDISTLLTADIGLHTAIYGTPSAAGAFVHELEDRLTRIAGIHSAAVSRWAFIAGFAQTEREIEVEGRDLPAGASPRFSFAVTPGYFRTLGLELRAGRTFTGRDAAGTELTAVINDAFAARIWGDESPLGRRIRVPNDSWRTIVGVVSNVGASGLAARRAPPAYVYVPFAQSPGRPVTVHLRTVGRPYTAAPGLISAVRGLDRDEPVENVKSAEDVLATELLPARVAAVLVDSVATLAVLLAAIGLYGVVAYTVGRRAREFGIRMAVGATGRDVLQLVLGQAVRVTLTGALLGAAGAAAAAGVLRSVLWGTDPLDPGVFGASVLLLIVVMLAASLAPARRAARIEPQIALRDE